MMTMDPLEPGKKSTEYFEKCRLYPLTCIRDAYTLAATHEYASEVDQLMVKHFLDTLAEIALAAASRREAGK